jgi:peptidoglycan/LPS O-acetylase OafA/YrhL
VSTSPSERGSRSTRREKALRIASVLALLALVLMVWSVLDPRPAPVLIGLSVGQGIGTLSFVLYLLVVAADLRIKRRLAREEAPPSSR